MAFVRGADVSVSDMTIMIESLTKDIESLRASGITFTGARGFEVFEEWIKYAHFREELLQIKRFGWGNITRWPSNIAGMVKHVYQSPWFVRPHYHRVRVLSHPCSMLCDNPIKFENKFVELTRNAFDRFKKLKTAYRNDVFVNVLREDRFLSDGRVRPHSGVDEKARKVEQEMGLADMSDEVFAKAMSKDPQALETAIRSGNEEDIAQAFAKDNDDLIKALEGMDDVTKHRVKQELYLRHGARKTANQLTDIFEEGLSFCGGRSTFAYGYSRNLYKDTAMGLAMGSLIASYVGAYWDKGEEKLWDTITDEAFIFNLGFDIFYTWFVTVINSRIQTAKNVNYWQKYMQDQGWGTVRETFIIPTYGLGAVPSEPALWSQNEYLNQVDELLKDEEFQKSYPKQYSFLLGFTQELEKLRGYLVGDDELENATDEMNQLVQDMRDFMDEFDGIAREYAQREIKNVKVDFSVPGSPVDTFEVPDVPMDPELFARLQTLLEKFNDAKPDATKGSSNLIEAWAKKVHREVEQLDGLDPGKTLRSNILAASQAQHYDEHSGWWRSGDVMIPGTEQNILPQHHYGYDKYTWRRANSTWEAPPSILRNSIILSWLCLGRFTPMQTFSAAASLYVFEKYVKNIFMLGWRDGALGTVSSGK
ncbi:MAG: hypothetical protein R3A45_00605 [Bdellovibrionota bacterium]